MNLSDISGPDSFEIAWDYCLERGVVMLDASSFMAIDRYSRSGRHVTAVSIWQGIFDFSRSHLTYRSAELRQRTNGDGYNFMSYSGSSPHIYSFTHSSY